MLEPSRKDTRKVPKEIKKLRKCHFLLQLKSIALEKVKLLMQKARGVAKGAFSQVQTVAAFSGQDFEKKK